MLWPVETAFDSETNWNILSINGSYCFIHSTMPNPNGLSSRTWRWPMISTCPRTCSSGARRCCSISGHSRSLTARQCAMQPQAALQRTAVKIPNLSQHHPQHVGRPAAMRRRSPAPRPSHRNSSSWTNRRRPWACRKQPRSRISSRRSKANGEPLILISHNMRQVFDLVDRIVVFRRGRIVANLRKEDTNGQDVVAYITGAKTRARVCRRRLSGPTTPSPICALHRSPWRHCARPWHRRWSGRASHRQSALRRHWWRRSPACRLRCVRVCRR